jgi:hypothetical protein
VARAWGVVGVVQSDIREKELAAAKADCTVADAATAAAGDAAPAGNGCAADAPAAPAAAAAPGGPPPALPGGRAAALAARAALAGSGWALPPVLVFPEGTTSAGGCMITFRSGAFVGVRLRNCAWCTRCALSLTWRHRRALLCCR